MFLCQKTYTNTPSPTSFLRRVLTPNSSFYVPRFPPVPPSSFRVLSFIAWQLGTRDETQFSRHRDRRLKQLHWMHGWSSERFDSQPRSISKKGCFVYQRPLQFTGLQSLEGRDLDRPETNNHRYQLQLFWLVSGKARFRKRGYAIAGHAGEGIFNVWLRIQLDGLLKSAN